MRDKDLTTVGFSVLIKLDKLVLIPVIISPIPSHQPPRATTPVCSLYLRVVWFGLFCFLVFLFVLILKFRI